MKYSVSPCVFGGNAFIFLLWLYNVSGRGPLLEEILFKLICGHIIDINIVWGFW